MADPGTFAFVRRNLGTIRERFGDAVLPAGLGELEDDLREAIDRGYLPPVDVGYLAHAMVAVALELGQELAERHPPDVEGATAFVTALFAGGVGRLPRRYAAASCAPPPLLLIAVLSLLALPGAAQAKITVGIAENNPGMFSDPLFTQLGAKHARVVVSWNVADGRDDELNRVIQYVAARSSRASRPWSPSSTPAATRASATGARTARRSQCKLPTAKQYEAALRKFKAFLPSVSNIVAWNEINHFTQPTYKNPKAAARFTTIARKVFRGGTVVAADILDQADNVRAKRPTFRSATGYVKAFRKVYKGPRIVCGVHNYSDINRFRSTGTKAIIKALGCKQIWLTEAGGLYKFAGFKANQNRQLKATKYMFRVAKADKKVKRLYVYTWFGVPRSARFDAGLVGPDGKPRKAYAEVRKNVK